MESFNQMTQESVVKKEVSDNSLDTVDHSDNESLHHCSSVDSPDSEESGKRSLDCEQDSQDTDASGTPLPPRKRAKTQEEKEQRRMERIMRNRQAAHASREKKRKHLESLELRCTDLERENSHLSDLLTNYDQVCCRLQQLESAVKATRESGDISLLDPVVTAAPVTGPVDAIPFNEPVNGTVNGLAVGTTVSSESIAPAGDISGSTTPVLSGSGFAEGVHSAGISGSPAPSLEEDCASPEALFKIKNEEEIFNPYSPENTADHFGMVELSFEPELSTLNTKEYPESSSKSRHSAAMTSLFGIY